MEALTENSLNDENWCKTEIILVDLSYKWMIKNFPLRPERIGEYMKSSTFSDNEYDQYKWCLNLYPRGGRERRDYVTLELELIADMPVIINYTISILNYKNELRLWQKQRACHFVPGRKLGLTNYFERSLILERELGLIPDDTLTIICDITMMLETVNVTKKKKVLKKLECECKFIKNLCHLFENMKFSDVTLIVGDSEIKAHKNILASGSAVFEAMFENVIGVSKSNRVYITDISYKAVQEMIRFIYTGKILNFDDSAAELLMAADKYALKDLKELCEMELCDKLSVEEAADMLILADLYRADDLKAQSLGFISAHIIDVLKTEGWQKMIASHTHLVTGIVEAIVI